MCIYKNKIANWRFKIRDVPGDGNCLFHSVALSINSNATELRKAVVDWMLVPDQMLHGEKVSEWIQWNGNQNLQQYTQTMSRNGTWGGGIELAVLASILQKPILVYAKDTEAKRIAEFLPDVKDIDIKTLPTICILYVGRAHYMNLLPIKE
jgi:hypothetical protein